MTLSITTVSITIRKCDTQHKDVGSAYLYSMLMPSTIMLNVAKYVCYAACHYDECSYSESHCTEYRGTSWTQRHNKLVRLTLGNSSIHSILWLIESSTQVLTQKRSSLTHQYLTVKELFSISKRASLLRKKTLDPKTYIYWSLPSSLLANRGEGR